MDSDRTSIINFFQRGRERGVKSKLRGGNLKNCAKLAAVAPASVMNYIKNTGVTTSSSFFKTCLSPLPGCMLHVITLGSSAARPSSCALIQIHTQLGAQESAIVSPRNAAHPNPHVTPLCKPQHQLHNPPAATTCSPHTPHSCSHPIAHPHPSRSPMCAAHAYHLPQPAVKVSTKARGYITRPPLPWQPGRVQRPLCAAAPHPCARPRSPRRQCPAAL